MMLVPLALMAAIQQSNAGTDIGEVISDARRLVSPQAYDRGTMRIA